MTGVSLPIRALVHSAPPPRYKPLRHPIKESPFPLLTAPDAEHIPRTLEPHPNSTNASSILLQAPLAPSYCNGPQGSLMPQEDQKV